MATPVFDFETLRRLSIAERLQLVEDLWDSIAQDGPDEVFPMTPALAAELDRRLAEHERDPSSAIPWEQVRAEILDPARRRTP
ncbi:MAG: addiction module protein [Gemmatimonadaceae bacterium]